MIYMHEENIDNKINQNKQNNRKVNGYNNLKNELTNFKNNEYKPFQKKMLALSFDPVKKNKSVFQTATNYINDYYATAKDFSDKYKISAQSKFLSTILEEINCYLFKDVPQIVSGDYGIFNRSVCSGLIIESGKEIKPLTKDVDFCIGVSTSVSFGDSKPTDVVIPIVAVEVKTYLDATMFGEIKSSARELQGATPCAKTFVLSGYNAVKDTPIIVARNQPTPSEIFVLRKDKDSLIDSKVLKQYWASVCSAIESAASPKPITTPGKLLHP